MDAVEQQGSATVEISNSVLEAHKGTSEVSERISEVLSVAGETRESSDNIFLSAEDIAHQSNKLQNLIESFLTKINETQTHMEEHKVAAAE